MKDKKNLIYPVAIHECNNEAYKKELIKKVRGMRSGVKELLSKMGIAYNDLSVKVAYKEGYNQALSDVIKLVEGEIKK